MIGKEVKSSINCNDFLSRDNTELVFYSREGEILNGLCMHQLARQMLKLNGINYFDSLRSASSPKSHVGLSVPLGRLALLNPTSRPSISTTGGTASTSAL